MARRKRGKYRRRQYIAAGVNEVWAMDQHDKARKFGIAMHVCIEPFSGYVIWAKAWHTNRNPRVVASWYLEAIKKLEGDFLLVHTLSHRTDGRAFSSHSYVHTE